VRSNQVDTFQSDVAALTADLRGGRSGAVQQPGTSLAFEPQPATAPHRAPAGTVSARPKGAHTRTAVKPSASWRLGDAAPLTVGEPIDDGECSGALSANQTRGALTHTRTRMHVSLVQVWSPVCRHRRLRRIALFRRQAPLCGVPALRLRPANLPPRGAQATRCPDLTVSIALRLTARH
jgi:hypothetical protein